MLRRLRRNLRRRSRRFDNGGPRSWLWHRFRLRRRFGHWLRHCLRRLRLKPGLWHHLGWLGRKLRLLWRQLWRLRLFFWRLRRCLRLNLRWLWRLLRLLGECLRPFWQCLRWILLRQCSTQSWRLRRDLRRILLGQSFTHPGRLRLIFSVPRLSGRRHDFGVDLRLLRTCRERATRIRSQFAHDRRLDPSRNLIRRTCLLRILGPRRSQSRTVFDLAALSRKASKFPHSGGHLPSLVVADLL